MGYRFPFAPYPRSWYVVAYSDELAPGELRTLAYFGRELVLFRGEDGRAAVLDAHCPHLGAHLGAGCVRAGALECPFHGWRFDGAGRCVEIPRASKIPPRAQARSWPVREHSGLVLIYFDPDGAAPTWEPPEIPELTSADWLPVERRRWTVRTHVKETNENNCDSAHLTFVHGLVEVRSTGEARDHLFEVRHVFKADMERVGMPGTIFEGVVEGTHAGLGVLQQRFRVLVEGLLCSLQTPIDEEHVDLRFAFTARRGADETLARTARDAMLRDVVRDVEDDIRIWERKAYLEHPMLCDADGPIGLYRRWMRQF
jgi:phenylpropionate dioxygenase-like ring-hydroxylating dioxygenase large terminal subunit